MRDDPYYLVDDPPPRPALQDDEVDSIPIIRLDDMLLLGGEQCSLIQFCVFLSPYGEQSTSMLHSSANSCVPSRVRSISVTVHLSATGPQPPIGAERSLQVHVLRRQQRPLCH